MMVSRGLITQVASGTPVPTALLEAASRVTVYHVGPRKQGHWDLSRSKSGEGTLHPGSGPLRHRRSRHSRAVRQVP
jgi:hypothetical protein